MKRSALIPHSLTSYKRLYKKSISSPEVFWSNVAKEYITWFKPWQKTITYTPSRLGTSNKPYVEFYKGGKLNISYNCLDRHIEQGKGNKIAVIWQSEKNDATKTYTFLELQEEVIKCANVLKKLGVKKGNVVTIFMPMIPEAAIAMLACTRISAIHSVVFSAFSANALAKRLKDSRSQHIITADVSYYGGKTIRLKEKVDEARIKSPFVKHVLTVQREAPGKQGADGDHSWGQMMADPAINKPCPAVSMDAEDPLFILYTSGSTGQPKGIVHTTGGYLVWAHATFAWTFNPQAHDIFWCTADIGWITGHSYSLYAPLSHGITTLFVEGVPTYPTPDRNWQIIDRHAVTIFYTAPTAIRTLMSFGDTWPKRHSLATLKTLGTVGEPINPEAWHWYNTVIGKKHCPIIDTWWQTETGGFLIAPLAHITPLKPGSATLPLPGIKTKVITDDGKPVSANTTGALVITKPWPGMLRGLWKDKKHTLLKKIYFSKSTHGYYTADNCRIDNDGYHWLLGRIDDVINVSAHRFSTTEIENTLATHNSVAESAVVGFPHPLKGQGIGCVVIVKKGQTKNQALKNDLIAWVRKKIGPFATIDAIYFFSSLPKTRSGKVMRRIIRAFLSNNQAAIGDISTLANPEIIPELKKTLS